MSRHAKILLSVGLLLAAGLLVAGDTVSWLAAQQYWPVN